MKPMLTAFLVLWTVLPARAQEAAKLEQAIQAYVQKGAFMGSVLVARDTTIVLSKGYGMANLEWEIPNTPATKFRLGSITKQFTAASILLLEERGKLQTSDPIKKYFPDAPAAWDAITIHHLLTHTSGIKNYTAIPAPAFATLKTGNNSPDQIIATVRDMPLDFPVGEKMSYSNSGYVVLGMLIEKLSGGTYEAFVQDNIFTPLGMKDSGYDSNTKIIAKRAAGYVPSPAGPINAGYVHMSTPYAAGALYSTTEDMLKWERGLLGGKVVSAALLKKMLTPEKNDYAYGLITRTHNGHRRIWHNGGIDGFNTSMAHYPDSKVTIIILGNLNGQAPDLLVAQLGAIANGDTDGLPK
jgi:CubicO group peptidase (beta-lactamase class C family)